MTEAKIILIFLTLAAAAAGKAMRMKRVVGGNQYAKGDYPFHVSLWYMGSNNIFTANTPDLHHTCGGSVIASRWILTSAACFDDDFIDGLGNVDNWKVVVGMYGQKDAEDEAQFMQIESVFLSPNYDLSVSYGDIALLKLTSPVNLDAADFAVPNEDDNCPNDGQSCTVIGWGQLSESPYGYGSEFPNEATIEINNTETCAKIYSAENVQDLMGVVRIDGGTVCAGVMPEGGIDACYGDSGSPLLCQCNGGQGNLQIVATVSTGFGCARPDFPAIFTRVSTYKDWIANTIETN